MHAYFVHSSKIFSFKDVVLLTSLSTLFSAAAAFTDQSLCHGVYSEFN